MDRRHGAAGVSRGEGPAPGGHDRVRGLAGRAGQTPPPRQGLAEDSRAGSAGGSHPGASLHANISLSICLSHEGLHSTPVQLHVRIFGSREPPPSTGVTRATGHQRRQCRRRKFQGHNASAVELNYSGRVKGPTSRRHGAAGRPGQASHCSLDARVPTSAQLEPVCT